MQNIYYLKFELLASSPMGPFFCLCLRCITIVILQHTDDQLYGGWGSQQTTHQFYRKILNVFFQLKTIIQKNKFMYFNFEFECYLYLFTEPILKRLGQPGPLNDTILVCFHIFHWFTLFPCRGRFIAVTNKCQRRHLLPSHDDNDDD